MLEASAGSSAWASDRLFLFLPGQKLAWCRLGARRRHDCVRVCPDGCPGYAITLTLIRRCCAFVAHGVAVGARDPHPTQPKRCRAWGCALIAAFVVVGTLTTVCSARTPTVIPSRPGHLWGIAMFALGIVDDLHPLGLRRKLILQVLMRRWFIAGHPYRGAQGALRRQRHRHRHVERRDHRALAAGLPEPDQSGRGRRRPGRGHQLMLMGLLAYTGFGRESCRTSPSACSARCWRPPYNFPPRASTWARGTSFLGFTIGCCR